MVLWRCEIFPKAMIQVILQTPGWEDLRHRLQRTPGPSAQSPARRSNDSSSDKCIVPVLWFPNLGHNPAFWKPDGCSTLSGVGASLVTQVWSVWESLREAQTRAHCSMCSSDFASARFTVLNLYLKCFCILPWTLADTTIFPISVILEWLPVAV